MKLKKLKKEFWVPHVYKKLWKRNNAWNIRPLVDELIVPATQLIILKIVGFYDCFWSLFYIKKFGTYPRPTHKIRTAL